MGSRALVADSKEAWVFSYLSLALLVGVGLYALAGWWWADPIAALAMLPVIAWQGLETPHRHTPTRHRTRRGDMIYPAGPQLPSCGGTIGGDQGASGRPR
jgi:hypothetical protein